MRRAITVLLISISLKSVAMQHSLPDSLKNLLATETVDSEFIDRVNHIAFDFLKSDPLVGREIATISAEKAKEINYVKGYARALNVKGSSFWVVGEYESALDFYQMSAREAGAGKDSVGLSHAYHNMGEVYKKVGDLPRSIEYLTYSLNHDIRNKVPHAITLYNIGEAYLMLNQLKRASEFFDRALSQAIAEQSERTLAYTYQGQGLIKSTQKEYVPALAYLTKAERLWKQLGETRSLIQTYQHYADIFTKLEQFKDAEQKLDQATSLAAKIDASDLQITNYEKLAQLNAARGDFKKAWAAMLSHNQLRDSVYNMKKSEQIARLQALFETESRDIENNQLKKKQSIKDAQIRSQQFFIIAVSIAMVLAGIMAWILYRQQKRIAEVNLILNQKNAEIQSQKQEIEFQAVKLQTLNNELFELNKSLECRIELRTEQLMRQNQKLIEYAHANAHQLRAPVVSIMGLLYLIERIQLPENEQVMIHHLLKCATELDRITRDLSKALEEEILVTEMLDKADVQEG